MNPTAQAELRVELVQLVERHIASVRTTILKHRLRRTISVLHELVMDAVGEQGLAPAGPLFTRFHAIGTLINLECGMQLAQQFAPAGIVLPGYLPGGPALHGRHLGDHSALPDVYRALERYSTRSGHDPAGPPWECYVVDGRDSPEPSEWITDLYLPVRVRSRVGNHRTGGTKRSGLVALPVEQSIR